MNQFPRIQRLPPYVFNTLNQLKSEARARKEDIIDFGMGNPDQPTPKHIVDKLIETSQRPDTHGYSMSKGIPRLRRAMAAWYQRHYHVTLDSEKQIVTTIGSKEGLAHLALAISGPGDTVLVPDPAYPIHTYGFVIAGANVKQIPLIDEHQFLHAIEEAIAQTWPKPKALVISFPANPSTHCVDYDFFEQIIALAKRHQIWAPGIGFGQQGDKYVRFGLIKNTKRMRQALRNLKALFKRDGHVQQSVNNHVV